MVVNIPACFPLRTVPKCRTGRQHTQRQGTQSFSGFQPFFKLTRLGRFPKAAGGKLQIPRGRTQKLN